MSKTEVGNCVVKIKVIEKIMDMDNSRQSPSFDSSVASSRLEITSIEDMESAKTLNYVKEMLKTRIFLGRYLERRLINEIVSYRDVVVISPAEVQLKRDLLEAQHKLRMAYPNIRWIGITDTESFGFSSAGVCLWTEIDNQPFGPFWFQIKTLKYRQNEIIITLKCLRHITDAYLEVEPILTGISSKNKEKALDISAETLGDTYTEITGSLKSLLSISNVKEFISFLFVFIIAIFSGSVAFVNFLGNFILALIREISLLIKNSTPMFLGLVDAFSKIVGGFYILLAMFFRPSHPISGPPRTIGYPSSPYREKMHNREFD